MAVGHHNGVYRHGGNSDHSNASRTKTTKVPRGSWLQTDAEMRRKKRVAKYKVFTVEGKVKETVRNGCRWIKNKYLELGISRWSLHLDLLNSSEETLKVLQN